MTSIGDTLRRERLRRGWNLDQVAAETKISLHLLESIELDRFDRLPGGVFARNFVRQYAHMLKIDEEEILAAFHQQFEESAEELPEPEAAPVPIRHVSPWEALSERLGPGSSLSAFVGLVVVILACAGVYSLWLKARRSPPAPQVIAAAPKPKTELAMKPVETPKAEFRPAEVSDSGTIRVPEPPAPKPAAPIPTAVTEPNNLSTSAMRVAFKASEPVWVSIKSDGTRAFTGTLEGQQTREFDAAQRMTVLVGNAGSLDISLNGKPVGPIGGKGEIQLLVLTPSGVHVVPRTPRTSDDSTAPTEPVSDSDRP
jgi:cytoskeleton protein RodZ